MYMYMYIYMYMYMYICLYLYVYIFKYVSLSTYMMYACSMVGVRIHWGNQVATSTAMTAPDCGCTPQTPAC